jgi:hypothetical protein
MDCSILTTSTAAVTSSSLAISRCFIKSKCNLILKKKVIKIFIFNFFENDRFSNSAPPPPPPQAQRTNSYNGIPIGTMINPSLISIPPSSTQPTNMNNLLGMSMHARPTFDNFINTSSNNSSQQARRY